MAGLPAVTGLWAAIATLGCYALLGSSRQLSLGPESSSMPGVIPAMALVKQDLLPDLRAGALAARIGAEHIFPTLPTAVAAFRDQQGVELPPSPP